MRWRTKYRAERRQGNCGFRRCPWVVPIPGITKLLAQVFDPGFHQKRFQVSPLSLAGVAGIIEVIGSPLIIIGLFTRPVALVLCGEMAVAYFMAHAPQGHFLSPMLNQGESAVLYCFIFLFFAGAGAGTWSIDASRSTAAVSSI